MQEALTKVHFQLHSRTCDIDHLLQFITCHKRAILLLQVVVIQGKLDFMMLNFRSGDGSSERLT